MPSWTNILKCCIFLPLAFLPTKTLVVATDNLQIVPGATWTAINTGEHVQAHGAGFIKVDNLYYMIGEDKANGYAFQNVNCYSSPNLVEWTYVGALLSRQSSGDLGPNRVVERPKVIYNRSTRKYVLYMHIDSSDYKDAKVGVATGDSVCGRYTYHGSFQPQGRQSRDMGLYQDDDGSAYLLSEDRTAGLRIFKLSPDYLSVSSHVHLFPQQIEAPAMLKRNGMYYIFGSHLSGWQPNDNVYATARSISGPWSSWANFAPAGSKTYASQTTFVLPLAGDLVAYMGDRWTEGHLERSTYVWLPLTIQGSRAGLLPADAGWTVDVARGTVAMPRLQAVPAMRSGRLGGAARAVDCAPCDARRAAGYIGGTANGTVAVDVQVAEDGRRTMSIQYSNLDAKTRYAGVSVNGGKPVKMAFLATDRSRLGVSVLTTEFRRGRNEVAIWGVDGGWGPDVNAVIV